MLSIYPTWQSNNSNKWTCTSQQRRCKLKCRSVRCASRPFRRKQWGWWKIWYEGRLVFTLQLCGLYITMLQAALVSVTYEISQKNSLRVWSDETNLLTQRLFSPHFWIQRVLFSLVGQFHLVPAWESDSIHQSEKKSIFKMFSLGLEHNSIHILCTWLTSQVTLTWHQFSMRPI